MTKNFDDICKGILGEMMANPNQQQKPNQPPQPAGTGATTPQAGTGAQAAIQQNQQQTQQPAQQQTSQIKDEDLLKILADRIKDPKFLPQLQTLLNPQQPNAANQPVQKA